MASTFTLSGDVADLGLADYLVGPGNSRKIKGSVRSNLGAGDALIDTTTGLTLLGDTPVTIASDGTWSVTLIDTDATDLNVTAGTLQYELVVEYTSTGSPAKRVYRSGWFALTADTEFSALDLDIPSVTPSWRSEFRDEMEAIRDETAVISGLTGEDAAVALLIDTPASDTATSLSATIAAEAEPRALPSGRIGVKNYDSATGLYNGSALRKYRNALAKAAAGISHARVNIYGDSIAVGYPGAGAGSYERASWSRGLAARLASLYGRAGTGVCFANAGELDPRWTKTSGWVQVTQGYGAWGNATLFVSGTGTGEILTFTPLEPVDAFNVYYWAHPGGGLMDISVDGGTVTTVDQYAAAGILKSARINAGTINGHSLKIAVNPSNASGKTVMVWAAEGTVGTKGVRVSRIGKGSMHASDLVSPTGTSGAGVGDSLHSVFNMIPPDLSVIAFGHNEYVLDPQTAVADYKTNMQTLISKGLETGDVLLVTQVPNGNVSRTIPQAAYDQALYELADSNNVALLDLAALWGPRASNDALLYADSTHPSLFGFRRYEEDVAGIVAPGAPALDLLAGAIPLPVTGAAHRYVASATGSVGSNVALLADMGAATVAPTQPLPGKRPSVVLDSGLTALSFDGTDDFLQAAYTIAAATPVTVIYIVKPSSASTVVLGQFGNRRLTWSSGGAYGAYQSVTLSSAAASGWRFVAAVFDGASSKIVVDGTTVTGTVGTSATNNLLTLGSVEAGGAPAAMLLAEAVVYESALSDANIASLRAAYKTAYPVLP